MKLIKISIKHFRSIDAMEIDIYDFTSLIGPNNCGKSSILRAIELFIGQKKPEKEEWRNGEEDSPIEIIGVFDDIQEWERNSPGVAGIVNNGQIQLKYKAVIEDDKVTTLYEAFIREVEINGWADGWRELSQEIKDIAADIDVDNGTKWRSKANKERVREHILSTNPNLVTLGDEIWTAENISIAPALKQAIPQIVVVPAVSDASDETKTTSKTLFGGLLNKIVLPAIQREAEYQELIEAVNKITNKLTGQDGDQIEVIKVLTDDLSNRISSLIQAKALISLAPPDTEKFLGTNTILRLDDGKETPIHLQGHGVQRSLVFSLIEVLAKYTANQTEDEDIRIMNTILLYEEPELFLHPHLMRRLKDSLMQIAASNHWQVLISTHSPFLVDVADNPKSLVILQRNSPESPPLKNQLIEDPFGAGAESEKTALRAALDFHPTVNEAFFAQRVVLVEGDTEIAIFNHEKKPHLRFGIDHSKFENTTIVSCGGKWTIPAIARLLAKFGVPFRIVHDIDKKGRSEDELNEARGIDPYKANAKINIAGGGADIFQVDDTLEHIIFGNNGNVSSKDKPYRSWKKIQDWVNGDDTIGNEGKLKELFEFVYSW